MKADLSLKKSSPESEAPELLAPPAPAATAQAGTDDAPALPAILSILPVRNTVVFPGTIMPLSVGRPESLKLLEETLPQSRMVGVVAQRDPDKDQPGPDDLY